jgi:DNA-3-methyladenine glycosylase I
MLNFGFFDLRMSRLQEQGWQMPKWWYREKRPSSDDAYFENMSRVIFEAGLNWHVIDKKWSHIKAVFEGFSVEKVSRFTDADVERLLLDKGIVRNRNKIQGIIINAIQFRKIRQQYGSFQNYLESQDKSSNYKSVIKTLIHDFKRLGESSAALFLYTVAENISPWQY